MIPALPPLTRDETDAFLKSELDADRNRLVSLRSSLSSLDGAEAAAARAEIGVLEAAVLAPPSQSGVLGGNGFLSTASDGLVSRRIPDGWQEGVCWTPFCCTPAHSFLIDCGDDCGDGWVVPTNPHVASANRCRDTAQPFLIEVDEFENACSPADMERYAVENLRRWSSFHVAVHAHAQMRAAAVDMSGGVGVDPASAVDTLFANRPLGGALWVPHGAETRFVAARVLSSSGGRLVDPLGSRVFTGPGMPNVGPDGTDAPAGFAWVYISGGNVDYALEPIEVSTVVLPRGNARTPKAERKGLVRVDSCDVVAVLVKLPAEVCAP